MAWVKLDDQFTDHPKIVAAGPAASWLYICGLTYCARFLTDGFIPTGQVRRLADLTDPIALAAVLVKHRLWELCEDGYRVHDYLEYQPTKERVIATREARTEAGAKGGKQKAGNLLDKSEAKSKQKSTPYPFPVPYPVPIPGQANSADDEDGASAPPEPADKPIRPAPKPEKTESTKLPKDWQPEPELIDWACLPLESEGLDLPRPFVLSETERFIDYWTGAGGKKANWVATWRGWMRKEAQDRRPSARSPNGRLAPGEQAAAATERLRQKGYT